MPRSGFYLSFLIILDPYVHLSWVTVPEALSTLEDVNSNRD